MTRIKITSRRPKLLKLNCVQHQDPQLPTASDSKGSDDTKTTSNDSSDNIKSVHEESAQEDHNEVRCQIIN